jgi:hypothetical protein
VALWSGMGPWMVAALFMAAAFRYQDSLQVRNKHNGMPLNVPFSLPPGELNGIHPRKGNRSRIEFAPRGGDRIKSDIRETILEGLKPSKARGRARLFRGNGRRRSPESFAWSSAPLRPSRYSRGAGNYHRPTSFNREGQPALPRRTEAVLYFLPRTFRRDFQYAEGRRSGRRRGISQAREVHLSQSEAVLGGFELTSAFAPAKSA